ncbi:uncharacterized protein LOC124342655 isoform X1 [Daphnia pulicaria]|uniref:uncharacterized protein LOC124342655 isoform X1 n=1 Tax=Daphnia pulicaria TaxID=35523 RepID=UPI001EE9CC04|nr:uncharacterized protein LOC124342655 isoform X1 [Daphnia pulicaria]XP_046651687.1 uncharacterized protein LOC124342655 isoform X1 [Daphnia pulicaria]XP_046651688.1 uncharacterized protein LOC124342655 isoform X1 [Daphnia pulicaria]XP_046651689.1 uncharacterized protein LOC124342655 isoform X1 [Daphnia pulicaria]XP_046651690.1 uncharacterized protein LOC124342655 isoform X1 [Daphnia pulicaria]
MDILEEEEFNWIDQNFLRNSRPQKASYSNEKDEAWKRELGRQQERHESCENVSYSHEKQDPASIYPRDIKGRRSVKLELDREYTKTEILDLFGDEMNQMISDSCETFAFSNTPTKQDDLAEIEIIDLCDSENELHEEKSIPNLCGMAKMEANISIPQDEKIITASAVVLTDSEIKQDHQVSVNNNYFKTSKISKIIDRLAVPINYVLAGFEQIISALSFSSDMKSCSLVGASSSKNSNNLKPNPSMATLMDLNTLHHVSPKETLHNDSQPTKEENLMTEYLESEIDCYFNPPFHTCRNAPSIIGDNARSYSSEIRRKEGEVARQAPYVNLDTRNSPQKHSLKSRYRSDRRSSPMMNVKNVPKSDIECQLKQYEYADSEFQTSKTSLSAVEIEATRLISTNDECGIPQNLTSRKCELQFNGNNTQTLSYERDLLSENKPLKSSTSSLPPFIEGDKEVSTPCVSLECTTAPSSDSIVAPFVSRCSSMTEIPLRISTRQKSRPHRYRDTDDDLNMRHKIRMTKARSSSTKLRKPLINAVRSVNVEPVVECESLESYHVDDVEGILIFSFVNSEDLVKFCADQL